MYIQYINQNGNPLDQNLHKRQTTHKGYEKTIIATIWNSKEFKAIETKSPVHLGQ